MLDVTFDGAADMDQGVLGVAAAVTRQGHVGHRLARRRLVEQQRKDRVVVGRRGQLDLTASGQLAMERDHPGHQRALLVQKPLLLILGVVPPFRFELGELGVFLEEQGMDPGEVGPDLKVAEIASAEPMTAIVWPYYSHDDRIMKSS